jgi:hypothetical protein
MERVQDQAPDITRDEKNWIEENLAEQNRRHEQITTNMQAISPDRDAWIDAFFDRIQTRGFNYNCDQLRKINEDEMPIKPSRPFKVVF